MNRYIFIAAVFLMSISTAAAATANFTGRFEVTRTSTGGPALNCEYMAGGQFYWRMFAGSRCPRTIEVL